MAQPDARLFPDADWMEFGRRAQDFFVTPISGSANPDLRGLQFQQAWLAVRHRYRACLDSNEDYKTYHTKLMQTWDKSARKDQGKSDEKKEEYEEIEYKEERSMYLFFTSALSVLESLVFGLYFVGHAVSPPHFKHAHPGSGNPRKITLSHVQAAFGAAFPQADITARLQALTKEKEYKLIANIRNALAHRLVGGRSVFSSGETRPDSVSEDQQWGVWSLAGTDIARRYDNGLAQRRLDWLNTCLPCLVTDCLKFVKSNAPPQPAP